MECAGSRFRESMVIQENIGVSRAEENQSQFLNGLISAEKVFNRRRRDLGGFL
jgi:hypothetical protein